MNHIFSEVPNIKIPRSLFRRDHGLKTSINASYLYPIYCDEALPADTFKFKQRIFGRVNTPLFPIMDNLYLDTFYFAVPIRLLWDDWQKFMGERPFGDTTSVYTVPTLTTPVGGVAIGSLSDYIGIPPGVGGVEFSTLWHRAYNLIYNEWFRDELLCPPVPVGNKTETSSTHVEALSDYVLRRRGKRHDYFTSCLPTPQRGEQPSVSLLGYAPIKAINHQSINVGLYNESDTLSAPAHASILTSNVIAAQSQDQSLQVAASGGNVPAHFRIAESQLEKIQADLSGLGAVPINSIREAFAIQHYLERINLSGTRYIEQIRGLFGVVSPDARMQRPEYLGGSSVPIQVTTVPATSHDEQSATPVGYTGAFMTVSSDASWSKSFTEHCIIMGIANVRADLTYSQGLNRMFSRKTRYDFYLPQLANLGEQAVLNKEIYAQGTSADDKVFGYQERWAEYRYHPSMLTGQFRAGFSGSGAYQFWHLSQVFENLPTLSQTFIEEDVPLDRVLAYPEDANILLDGWFQIEAARPMPLYSVPGLSRL